MGEAEMLVVKCMAVCQCACINRRRGERIGGGSDGDRGVELGEKAKCVNWWVRKAKVPGSSLLGWLACGDHVVRLGTCLRHETHLCRFLHIPVLIDMIMQTETILSGLFFVF